MMTLATLLADTDYVAAPHTVLTSLLTGMTLNSRAVRSGELFVAVAGQRQHGLAFAPAAVANGCVALIAEPDQHWSVAAIHQLQQTLRVPVIAVPQLSQLAGKLAARFYGEPASQLLITGVTGTNGKTSVSHWLAQARAPRCGIIGTLGYGLPGDVSEPGLTTPDAVRLQAILADLRERGATHVAMEVSSHALAQGRVTAVPITTAVFTNLTRDHLDYHGDVASYAAAKMCLFQRPMLRHVILNGDDPFSLDIAAALAPEVSIAWYSINSEFVPPASTAARTSYCVRATALTPQPRGVELVIESAGDTGHLPLALLGQFNAANALAVVATLLATEALPLDQVLARVSRVTGVAGRMEIMQPPTTPAATLPLVVVDYAHTPDGLAQALRALQWHDPQRPVITVCGCGGDRDRGKRPLMGAVAAQYSHTVILTDDNPRHEDGAAIIADMRAGMTQSATPVIVERDRAQAIRRAIGMASADMVVLIAGKGHETTQDYGSWVQPFSDREQAALALAEVTQ